MDTKKNHHHKYTLHDILNEIMSIMECKSLYSKKGVSKMKENGPYTNMTDECTDVANTEQFTPRIRTENKI